MPALRLGLAQTNPTVGAIAANLSACFQMVEKASQEQVKLLVFGELAVTGYPIDDLATRKSFLQETDLAVSDFASQLEKRGYGDITVVIGYPALAPADEQSWAIAQNVAGVIRGGKVVARYAKHHLPNYSVFDEYRNFVAGNQEVFFEVEGIRCGLLICEDIWQEGGPADRLSKNEINLALILNGSPFEMGKSQHRYEIAQRMAREQGVSVAYVNLVGAQDDLVFDGGSFLTGPSGEVVLQGEFFKPDLLISEISKEGALKPFSVSATSQSSLSSIWQALTLGLADYVNKNGFNSVILGLSGGIDSAVCATLAVDALGADRVFGVSLPSRYSSEHSKSDAADLAERLGIRLEVQPIEPAYALLQEQLNLDGLAAENIQARIRAVILMGLSNQNGHLVLTTGNKTELAVGYSTIYGDSVGGFAPLKDVDKTLVWELARWRNDQAKSEGQIAPVPANSIEKPPSAELRPDQTDQDSLPEYDLLCDILHRYLELKESSEQIAAAGFDLAIVQRVIQMVNASEWKRRQGAVGPKITAMSFGRERRMPITNKYR